MMRVGMLISTYWPGDEGGAEKQCRTLAHEIRHQGRDCVVYAFRSSRAVSRFSVDQGVEVHRFGLLGPAADFWKKAFSLLGPKVSFWLGLPLNWLARLAFILEVCMVLRRNPHGVDILHVHESSWLAGLGVWLGKEWGVPVISKERSVPVLSVIGYDTPFRQRWDELRDKGYFIATHSLMKKELVNRGIPGKNISVIPNGVDIPFYTDSGTKKKPQVLYVGNFTQGTEAKAFDVLFSAWEQVVQAIPNARLILLGRGDSSYWKKIAEGIGDGSSASFPGFISQADDYYRQSSVFVLPSRREGMSNALLEAMAWGLPSVVSDIPGNVAVVTGGVTGLVVPVGDSNALARALIELLQAPGYACLLGKNARILMEKKYSRKYVTREMLELYYKLIEGQAK